MWSKARVAPLKKISIPRLELMACLIGARLARCILESLTVRCPFYLWTDSSTAISWIRQNRNWNIFVKNRVDEIQRTTKLSNRRFVPGLENPADLPSRVSKIGQFLRSKWWEGPDWLRLSKDFWPSEEPIIYETEKFSEFQSNVRLLAWMTRYINKCKKVSNQKGELTIEEIECSQRKCLVTLSKLREKYWILRGRKIISRILRQCVICRRYSAKPGSVEAAPLPTNRIHLGKPFQVTGIDLFGPLLLRNNTKTWVALFTCGVYRAVHVEVIQGLDTLSFLMALRRFISRRGRPLVIYSDNGIKFAETNKLLSHIDWNQMQNYSSAQKITWRFNPPVSFWERLIRIIKGIIKIMLGNKKLNFLQLETQICHVEAIVNERPLTYMSEDSDDFRPLTPAMYLQVNDDNTFPELDHICRRSLIEKYKKLQTLKEELKMKFYKEYLGELVQKKEDSDTRAITAGEVVYVGNDSQKRINWPLDLVRIKSGEIVRPIQRLYPLEIHSSDMEAYGVKNLSKNPSNLNNNKKMNSQIEKDVEKELY
ncbi:hypothetical protein LAZ67_1001280 [Cordylochernes scorpioides]|uniref:Integrase catalytic domain-containing protein n=1 Tax=Cordylochernes scorpioides TaxID=51811 RepID=A0ABY6JVM0_9ARAC|nr:hypothetical protein LAZ67_1001280 [Cordylochernes scorpioides]